MSIPSNGSTLGAAPAFFFFFAGAPIVAVGVAGPDSSPSSGDVATLRFLGLLGPAPGVGAAVVTPLEMNGVGEADFFFFDAGSLSGPLSALRFFNAERGDVGLVARPTIESEGLVGGRCGLVARRARKALPAPGAVGLVARATFGVEVPVKGPLTAFEPGAGDWPRGVEVLGFGDTARDSPLVRSCAGFFRGPKPA